MDRRDPEQKQLVRGEGPKPAVGMIIGEAPGAEEERFGRPFIGTSGRLLNEAIEAAGGKREEFYITNVYKLRPPNNRPPTDSEIDEHTPILEREYYDVDPRYVLLLGRTAADWHGFTGRHEWEKDDEGIYYLYTWHPSYALRMQGKAKEEFFEDVLAFVECVQNAHVQ